MRTLGGGCCLNQRRQNKPIHQRWNPAPLQFILLNPETRTSISQLVSAQLEGFRFALFWRNINTHLSFLCVLLFLTRGQGLKNWWLKYVETHGTRSTIVLWGFSSTLYWGTCSPPDPKPGKPNTRKSWISFGIHGPKFECHWKREQCHQKMTLNKMIRINCCLIQIPSLWLVDLVVCLGPTQYLFFNQSHSRPRKKGHMSWKSISSSVLPIWTWMWSVLKRI